MLGNTAGSQLNKPIHHSSYLIAILHTYITAVKFFHQLWHSVIPHLTASPYLTKACNTLETNATIHSYIEQVYHLIFVGCTKV